jgi:DEAD/DEAH box helicase domain-containing protein
MSIFNFIESLRNYRSFSLQIMEHKYIPPVKARYMKLVLSDKLKDVLKSRGIALFYSHQVEAINLIRQGENVVVMTPTASGKSLIYNIPVLESIIENPEQRALYIFPLKGLEQDQVKNLNELYNAVVDNTLNLSLSPAPPIKGGEDRRDPIEGGDIYEPSPLVGEGKGEGYKKVSTKTSKSILKFGEVYDGDTTAYRRKRIRETSPHVIFTNPDMLHLAINPFHKKWEAFFRNLRFVIIDEIHTYRGVFGSNVAHVMRRLRRICKYWGANPQFITASATIANPDKLAEKLIGVPFKVVAHSGAPQGEKHFIFINPIESPYTEATRLFIECLNAGLRTIIFTKARKITELIYTWTLNYAPELRDKISPYRAGFLPKERREIEQRLFRGDLLGVISTSALELGVDIGGLDCCILCGYPGSVASTWQRAGRVGRHGQESVIAMIAIQDALDQFFTRHPETFFEKSHEAAVIDPENRNILKRHIPCASSEVYLRADDDVYDIKKLMPLIDELVEEGILNPGRKGDIWFSRRRMPHREVGIRAIGEPFDIVNESGKAIGELSGGRVFRDAFPGAIYLHRGRQYQITWLELEKKRVICKEVDVNYYTQALSKEETEVIKEKEMKDFKCFSVYWGILKTTQKITGYEKKRIFDRTRISRHDLDMPEYVFETEGLWIKIDKAIQSFIESKGFDLAGTLHAVEHTAIACIPLFALCDRGDIGGLSYTFYPKFKQPVIFIYDGYEGGIGLTKRATEVIGDWLMATLRIIDECPCEEGCPSCVQDPQCGSGNQPLDKEGAKELLKRWLL